MSTKKELPKKYDHTGRTGDQKTDVLAIYNNARAFTPSSARIDGEDRGWNADYTSRNLAGEELKTYYLNKFTPAFMQGKNFTAVMGLSFGF